MQPPKPITVAGLCLALIDASRAVADGRQMLALARIDSALEGFAGLVDDLRDLMRRKAEF